MGRIFGIWISQAIGLSVIVGLVFIGLKAFDMDVGTTMAWVSGVACYWVLSAITVLPWNVHFMSRDVLDAMLATEEKGGTIDTRDRDYAVLARNRSGQVAIAIHIISATAFAALAAYTPLGTIGYFAAVAALGLTVVRPAIRSVEHVLGRLNAIEGRTHFPRDDVYDLKERMDKLAHFDDIAKELREDFKETREEIQKTHEDAWRGINEESKAFGTRVDALDKHISQMHREVSDKIDTFDDAVAFKTAWDRIAPEIGKVFRS